MRDESDGKHVSGADGGLSASAIEPAAQPAKRSFEDGRSQTGLGNENKVRPPLWRRLASYALRGGVAGLILGVGVWTLQGIAALFHVEPEATSSEAAQSLANNPLPVESLAATDLMSGAWGFMDEGWAISAELLAEENARDAFESPLPADATGTQVASDPRSNELHDRGNALLAVIKPRSTRTREGEMWRYSVSQGGCQMRVYATSEQPEQFRQADLLIPYDGGRSWLMRFRPDDVPSAPHETADSPMPVTLRSRLLCERKNAAGEIFCQLFRVEATFTELLSALHKDRWEIGQPSGKRDSGFVTIHVHRATESFWLVASSYDDDPSLRILIVHDLMQPVLSGSN